MLMGVFPYVALALAIIVGIQRRLHDPYTYSSLSSQFLENRSLFLGAIPWHFGILLVLLGHILGMVVPGLVAWWNGSPVRLYILESTALTLGFLALFGMIVLLIRRFTDARIRVVTSAMDVVLVILLLFQAFTGVFTALFYRWGSSWYISAAVPYLWSIFTFRPDVSFVSGLPLITKLHIINAWVLFVIFPFTRLVHLVSWPIGYLTRPYQVVWWNKKSPQGSY